MLIHIDYNTGEPISRQVADQIKWMVVSGALQPGQKLPSIRQLAGQLKVNPTTVTRIYNELEHDRVITLRQGQGAFVSEPDTYLRPEQVEKLVAEKARQMLVEGLRLGLTKSEIQKILDSEFSQIRKAKNE